MQIYPPPAPPLESEGYRAPIVNSKIYRYLLGLPAPLPAGREGQGVGRILIIYAQKAFRS